MNRQKILTDLIGLKESISALSHRVSKLGWDYDGPQMIVATASIQDVIQRFIDGELSGTDLEGWVNLLEGREDLAYEKNKREQIEHIIYCLANPALQGDISIASCKEFLLKLK